MTQTVNVIPFYRPPRIEGVEMERLMDSVTGILDSGKLTNGENCRKLEARVSEMYGVEHIVVCSSGTQGLWIAVQCLPKLHVTIPAYEWKSLTHVLDGRKISYVDVDMRRWHVNPEEMRRDCVNIVNQTFGSVAEHPQTGVVLYDAAHSLGADIREFGDASIFAMSPTKPVTSCEGGLIVTHSDKLAKQLRETRDKVSRLPEINAAIGLAYLSRVKRTVERKREIVNYYRKHLTDFTFQEIPRSTTCSVCNVVTAPLDAHNIKSHLEKYVELRSYHEPLKRGLRNTDFLFSNSFALPVYPDLDERQVVKHVLGVIDDLFGARRTHIREENNLLK